LRYRLRRQPDLRDMSRLRCRRHLRPLRQSTYFSSPQNALNSYSRSVDKPANASRAQMKHELAGIPAWAYITGMPAVLVAVLTPALLAVASLLPANLIWLCYLMPVVLASVRWGFASAAATAVTAGLAGDFFFTQPYHSLWMDDRSDVAALLLFLIAAFGIAVVITNTRQLNHDRLNSSSAVHKLFRELAECQTSHDVIVHFNRWISVVARGRAALVHAEPFDTQPVILPDEIQRVATGMCGTSSDDVRIIAGTANRRWFLKPFRSDGIVRGIFAVETEIEGCDCNLVEVAIASAAVRFSELAHREALAAAADQISGLTFSYQWRTSLTTILGAAGVLLMRGKFGASRLDRTLLADIRDEAVQLSQLLTDAFPAARATVHDNSYRQDCGDAAQSLRQIGLGAPAAINLGKKST
jgi:K+-sensing histidine kinase KdpD